MYHRCQHCDQPFESAAARPRCPRCLRITTVVPLGAPPPPAASDPGAEPPPRRVRSGSRPLPWTLWLGVVTVAATGVAALGTDYGAAAPGERAGLAITYAALGGAGLGLAAWGLLTWRKRR